MWICHHIHFIHHLVGVLFLQTLLFPLSGELLSFLPQNVGKHKPHIWTRATLAREARPIQWVMPHIFFIPTLHPRTHSCTHAYMWHIPCMVLCWYSDGVVTLTSSAQGGICPGEEVILTCTVTGGVILEWSSTAFSNRPVQYLENDPVGQPINHGNFTATLDHLWSTKSRPITGKSGIHSEGKCHPWDYVEWNSCQMYWSG